MIASKSGPVCKSGFLKQIYTGVNIDSKDAKKLSSVLDKPMRKYRIYGQDNLRGLYGLRSDRAAVGHTVDRGKDSKYCVIICTGNTVVGIR